MDGQSRSPPVHSTRTRTDEQDLKFDRRKLAPKGKTYGASSKGSRLAATNTLVDKENVPQSITDTRSTLINKPSVKLSQKITPRKVGKKPVERLPPSRQRMAFAVVINQPLSRLSADKSPLSTSGSKPAAESTQVSSPKAHRKATTQTKRRTRRAVAAEDEPVQIEDARPAIADSDVSSILTSNSPSFEPALAPVLDLCTSSAVIDFAHFVSNPPLPFSSTEPVRWRKIGEASYSEVFEAQNTVVKIIPVASAPLASDSTVELPYLSDADLIRREILVSSLCGGPTSRVDGFVRFKGAFLVRGKYPAALLRQWDLFKRRYPDSDEQIRPDVLPDDQVYAVICLENAGVALEDFKIKTWQQAASVLWQVAKICAAAEREHEFEHRDLHWGNVLLRETPIETALEKLSLTSSTSNMYDAAQTGLEAVLIDFTLSRARLACGDIVYDPFDDECVFEGEGDYQYDVYRNMKRHVKGKWASFCPLTNVMWLHYLAHKLVKDKKLKQPRKSSSTKSAKPSASEQQAYSDLVRAQAHLARALDDKSAGIKSAQDVWSFLSDMDSVTSNL
ncbi:hypothetical protein ACM66B_000587 [Microbotryomycetes sp. NB124-2]